jgi:ribosomal 30S subunit maturation factor RimM
VMVVTGERERLIPAVAGAIVQSVDVKARRIVVAWEPEY